MKLITTQDKVYMSITTPLGKDKIFLRHVQGTERFSDLFEFKLELYVPFGADPKAIDLDFTKIIEKTATIEIAMNKKKRYINGIITEIAQGPTFSTNKDAKNRGDEMTLFYATLRPQAWLMTLTEDCQIFQKKDAITIIKSLLTKHAITIQDNTSTCGKEVRDFCVQYNESDFNFISRLMEEEGIFYFFEHANGTHTMTLEDGAKPLKKIKDADFQTIKVSPYQKDDTPFLHTLYDLRVSQKIVPSKHTYNDYDFEKPTNKLKVDSKGKGKLREYYHYPGRYSVKTRGTTLSDMRMAEMEFPKDAITAKSDVHMLEVAHTFTLSDELNKKAIRTDINKKEFTVFAIEHDAYLQEVEPSTEGGIVAGGTHLNYENTTTFYKKDVVHRPLRKAPLPRIYGTQTATVSGKAGEEIWTDKYGRVMVKFHWDLSDTKDDKVSCWVRVAQGWTGTKWGAFFIPRVGQEVVVTFLNGDPDQPLITGCVYNATNMMPYGPKEATKSGIKTNTSKGGGGFNEIHFEDKKGKENFYMHAQTDMTTMVLDGQRSTTIKGTKGKGHEILTMTKGNRTTTLDEGNDTLTLQKGDSKTTLQKGNMTTTLQKGDHTVDVTGNSIHKASKNYTLTVGKDATIKIDGNCTLDVGKNFSIKVGKNYILKAAQIAESAQKGITSKGMKVDIEAKTTMDLKGLKVGVTAKAMATVKGPMIDIKGAAMTKVEGAMTTVKGAMVKVTGMVMLG